MQKNRKRIGLFGGTFDPIHLGHLNLVIELREKWNLDEVWFIPTYVNPHKMLFPPTAAEHRLKMLKLAIKDFSDFFIKDLELQRGPPSYTVDTISALLELDGGQSEFFWLMGEDALVGFNAWQKPEKIISMVKLLIGSRWNEKPCDYYFENEEIAKAIQMGWTKICQMDISGTILRQRLMKGLYCGHLLSYEVFRYINQNQLYVDAI